MKNLISIFTTLIIITSCGGGGGGGGGGALNSSSPSYSYVKMLDRLENGTISSFNEVGRSLIYTYHDESSSMWYWSEDENFNLGFSRTTDSSGNEVVSVSYSQNVDVIPDGYTTDLGYNRSYDITLDGYQINQISNAPNYSNAFEYYSNASLSITGTWEPSLYPGTEYVDMIMWHMDYDNGYMDDFVSFAYGDKTFSSDMPSTGSANFNVASFGFWNYSNNVYYFKGDGQLTANFASMTLSGQINNDYVTESPYGWSQIIGGSAGTVSLTGDISGASFSGVVEWAGSGLEDGEFEGSFFGPNAKEVGGTYVASESENGYLNNITGSFIGSQ